MSAKAKPTAGDLRFIGEQLMKLDTMASQLQSIYFRFGHLVADRLPTISSPAVIVKEMQLDSIRQRLAQLEERVTLLERKPTVLEGSGNKQGVWMDRDYVAALEKKAGGVATPRARSRK